MPKYEVPYAYLVPANSAGTLFHFFVTVQTKGGRTVQFQDPTSVGQTTIANVEITDNTNETNTVFSRKLVIDRSGNSIFANDTSIVLSVVNTNGTAMTWYYQDAQDPWVALSGDIALDRPYITLGRPVTKPLERYPAVLIPTEGKKEQTTTLPSDQNAREQIANTSLVTDTGAPLKWVEPSTSGYQFNVPAGDIPDDYIFQQEVLAAAGGPTHRSRVHSKHFVQNPGIRWIKRKA